MKLSCIGNLRREFVLCLIGIEIGNCCGWSCRRTPAAAVTEAAASPELFFLASAITSTNPSFPKPALLLMTASTSLYFAAMGMAAADLLFVSGHSFASCPSPSSMNLQDLKI
ncbi:hypothetical protein AKJ16_DCAP22427 [Drosera capensis]